MAEENPEIQRHQEQKLALISSSISALSKVSSATTVSISSISDSESKNTPEEGKEGGGRSEMPTPDVCVVGAGMAGLRCAAVLLEKGARVTIFEARDRIGGRVSSCCSLTVIVIELIADLDLYCCPE